MRLIDADALKDVINAHGERIAYTVSFIWAIDEMPTIDAEPVRHGRWNEDDCCSECGQYVYFGDVRNYCPKCGAKMDLEEVHHGCD